MPEESVPQASVRSFGKQHDFRTSYVFMTAPMSGLRQMP